MRRIFTFFLAALAVMVLHGQGSVKAAVIVDSWWPTEGAQLTGSTPFKGFVGQYNVNDYVMSWNVDGGQLNDMPTSYADYPHKEAMVDVRSWTWKGKGPYKVSYIAKNKIGIEIGRTSFNVYNPAASTQAVAVPIQTPVVNTKVTANAKLYVDQNTSAKQQADAWRFTRPADATQLDKIATSPSAKWLGGWSGDVKAATNTYVTNANKLSQLPVLVTYNIPQRDCGSYSAGGLAPDAYLNWVRSIASGIGSQKALVIVEPDALPGLDCLSQADQATRLRLITESVGILRSNPQTYVYLDAGHVRWKTPEIMAQRLKQANVANANGFSLNVSNFIANDENTVYGQKLSALLDNKHFVIDTSRNGRGATFDMQWCNPVDRALGERPSTTVSHELIDAYLWIKSPGESDGTCNGGPLAGAWWPDYALGLAQRAAY